MLLISCVLLYLGIAKKFEPLLLLPILGLWYITFLSQFLVYDQLDQELGIEEKGNLPVTPSTH